jgi:hypothetical protein
MIVALLLMAVGLNAQDLAHFEKPKAIQYGASAAQTEQALAGLCAKRRTRVIERPFLRDVKRRQLQIDCDGFPFMGKGRWAEFVIRDDKLEMVWIMVDAVEQQAIVAAMTKAHGKPTSKTSRYIAFTKGRAAWRHKPAEVLFYSPALAYQVEPWLEEK